MDTAVVFQIIHFVHPSIYISFPHFGHFINSPLSAHNHSTDSFLVLRHEHRLSLHGQCKICLHFWHSMLPLIVVDYSVGYIGETSDEQFVFNAPRLSNHSFVLMYAYCSIFFGNKKIYPMRAYLFTVNH